MDSPETNERVDLELQRLERRLDELVTICRQLQEENQSLRVEAMVSRLKAMEQAQ